MTRLTALVLAAVLAASASAAAAADPVPYSCRLYYDEQKKCAFGQCDRRALDRLKNECLRDGGRP
jgi:opacity protein-like surface antigen